MWNVIKKITDFFKEGKTGTQKESKAARTSARQKEEHGMRKGFEKPVRPREGVGQSSTRVEHKPVTTPQPENRPSSQPRNLQEKEKSHVQREIREQKHHPEAHKKTTGPKNQAQNQLPKNEPPVLKNVPQQKQEERPPRLNVTRQEGPNEQQVPEKTSHGIRKRKNVVANNTGKRPPSSRKKTKPKVSGK